MSALWHLGLADLGGDGAQALIVAFTDATDVVAAHVLPWDTPAGPGTVVTPVHGTVAGDLVAAQGYCRWRGEGGRFTVTMVTDQPIEDLPLELAEEVELEGSVPIRWVRDRGPVKLAEHRPLWLVTYRVGGVRSLIRVMPGAPDA